MTDVLPVPGAAPAVEPGRASESGATAAEVEELARRARDGCRVSFEALVTQFGKRIFHYIYQMTQNQHDAEDLTQVTFLKAFRNIHRYRSDCAFSAWLFTIAKRTALNHFRDSRPSEELDPEIAGQNEHPAVTLERAEARSNLWTLARSLKPDQYEALWLRYGEGFSISEVAGIMKTNCLRVRVLLHRGRAALAKKLTHGLHSNRVALGKHCT